jgi:hypothetical protein
MKKKAVLFILFVFPVVAYLFFASGVNNFGKLPILTDKVPDIAEMDPNVQLKGKITVLGFLGNDLENKKGYAFNLNQKIYKRFGEFNDFQVVMVVPKGNEAKAMELKSELGELSEVDKWYFVYGSEEEVQSYFNWLGTDLKLANDLSTPYVFIIDKNLALRGRNDDEDQGMKYGFDTSSVADLNNKMVDDVKIILAEYRLALKKNNADRIK